MDLRGFLDQTGLSVYRVCEETGIGYSTLHNHLKHGKRLGLEVAEKLEAYSFERAKKLEAETPGMLAPKMLAVHILGLRITDAEAPPPARRKRKAA